MTYHNELFTYRITSLEYSDSLVSSGKPARWNKPGNFVIYSAESRALACLENLVHRSSIGLNRLFKIIQIQVPQKIKIIEIKNKELKTGWNEYSSYPYCQEIGEKWYKENKFCILKVPSSIIFKEYIYIFNTMHQDFKKIKINISEDFLFDQRIKN